jgi:ribosome-associated translation inhibitor RaiA
MTEEHTQELGGNITLVGFKDIGYAESVIVKKVVGNYARKFSEKTPFTNLRLTLKPIHKTTDDVTKFEIKANLEIDGTFYHTELVEHNLFMAIDTILKKLEAQIK